jgi:glycosyltransferase involved in cell wall biosynthesis
MKGHAHVLAAAPRVLAQASHSRFLLVGDGPLQESLAMQIRDAGLDEAVRLLGARDDVPRLLAASDVMILPSLAEGLPNVVLEGMAAGLPVVASAVGGIPELVSDGETGLLTQAGDAEALAAGILRLVEDRALAAGLGARGRARVEAEFTDAQTTAHYLELFTRFLARKSPA